MQRQNLRKHLERVDDAALHLAGQLDLLPQSLRYVLLEDAGILHRRPDLQQGNFLSTMMDRSS